jgi:hypothetical protein
MISVAMWTKFPESYVLNKIEPKLKTRGIEVTKYLSPRSKKVDLSKVDCVLFMNELSSHAEINRLLTITAASSKEAFPLSRKESSWGKELSVIDKFKKQDINSFVKEKKEQKFLQEQALAELNFHSESEAEIYEELYQEHINKLETRIKELEFEKDYIYHHLKWLSNLVIDVKIKKITKPKAFDQIISLVTKHKI